MRSELRTVMRIREWAEEKGMSFREYVEYEESPDRKFIRGKREDAFGPYVNSPRRRPPPSRLVPPIQSPPNDTTTSLPMTHSNSSQRIEAAERMAASAPCTSNTSALKLEIMGVGGGDINHFFSGPGLNICSRIF